MSISCPLSAWWYVRAAELLVEARVCQHVSYVSSQSTNYDIRNTYLVSRTQQLFGRFETPAKCLTV